MTKEELKNMISILDEEINNRMENYSCKSNNHKNNTNTLITIQSELKEILENDEDYK